MNHGTPRVSPPLQSEPRSSYRKSPPSPPLALSKRHLKFDSVSIGEFLEGRVGAAAPAVFSLHSPACVKPAAQASHTASCGHTNTSNDTHEIERAHVRMSRLTLRLAPLRAVQGVKSSRGSSTGRPHARPTGLFTALRERIPLLARWRGFRALAFVESVKGPERNGRATGENAPRSRALSALVYSLRRSGGRSKRFAQTFTLP